MRSRAPSLQSAIATRLPDACCASTCLPRASNTLAQGSARSDAKLWPARAPTSMTLRASGTANGVSFASAALSSRSFHSVSLR